MNWTEKKLKDEIKVKLCKVKTSSPYLPLVLMIQGHHEPPRGQENINQSKQRKFSKQFTVGGASAITFSPL